MKNPSRFYPAQADAEGLADAVGDKNAAFILARSEPSGSLKGEALVNEYGLSPDENNRRMMAKEERKGAILDPEALASVAAKREADTLAASRELSEHRQEALNAIAKAQRKPEKSAGQGTDGGENEVQSDEIFSPAEDDRPPIVPRMGGCLASQGNQAGDASAGLKISSIETSFSLRRSPALRFPACAQRLPAPTAVLGRGSFDAARACQLRAAATRCECTLPLFLLAIIPAICFHRVKPVFELHCCFGSR